MRLETKRLILREFTLDDLDAFTELGMSELISIIEPKNTRSLAVGNRIGMKYLKDTSFHNIPVQIYMINAPEEL